jgi:3-phytase
METPMRLTCVAAGLVLFGTLGGADAAEQPATISQGWASTGVRYGNTDSLTCAPLADGRLAVFATAKDTHRIDVFDAGSGRYIRSVGKPGAGAGEFRRPNGIVAITFPASNAPGQESKRTAILVIERDNHRVQAFWSDDFSAAGMFGAAELRRPYGGAVSYRGGEVQLYVTDTNVAPDRTVHVFQVKRQGDRIEGRHLRAMGERAGPGLLREVESIVVDDQLGRMFVCDEPLKHAKVYSLGGHYLNRSIGDGLVQGDPEGIAIIRNGPRGFILLTDQRKDITIWHVFDRRTLAYVASLTGEPRVANMDGICVHQAAFKGFPHGALFAVNDDADLRAYRIEDVLRAIGQGRSEGGRQGGQAPADE